MLAARVHFTRRPRPCGMNRSSALKNNASDEIITHANTLSRRILLQFNTCNVPRAVAAARRVDIGNSDDAPRAHDKSVKLVLTDNNHQNIQRNISEISRRRHRSPGSSCNAIRRHVRTRARLPSGAVDVLSGPGERRSAICLRAGVQRDLNALRVRSRR